MAVCAAPCSSTARVACVPEAATYWCDSIGPVNCGPNRSSGAGPRSGSVCLPSDWLIRRGGWTPRAGCSVELRRSTLHWRLPSGPGFLCWCIAFRPSDGCRMSSTVGWRLTAIASRARRRTANHIRKRADGVLVVAMATGDRRVCGRRGPTGGLRVGDAPVVLDTDVDSQQVRGRRVYPPWPTKARRSRDRE